jgi:hypothetical protein
MHFGVRPARKLMRASSDDDAFAIDDNGAHHRVWTGAAASTFGNRQRARHVVGVGEHGRIQLPASSCQLPAASEKRESVIAKSTPESATMGPRWKP